MVFPGLATSVESDRLGDWMPVCMCVCVCVPVQFRLISVPNVLNTKPQHSNSEPTPNAQYNLCGHVVCVCVCVCVCV